MPLFIVATNTRKVILIYAPSTKLSLLEILQYLSPFDIEGNWVNIIAAAAENKRLSLIND
jgi:hypothetical protein